jgi:hypothetical protein
MTVEWSYKTHVVRSRDYALTAGSVKCDALCTQPVMSLHRNVFSENTRSSHIALCSQHILLASRPSRTAKYRFLAAVFSGHAVA